jgi:hypothetical protein
MVKRHDPPETGETVCPACGAAIKATPASRRRRVQCPKCREIVSLENAAPTDAEATPPRTVSPEAADENRRRIEILEARVEALEAALKDVAGSAPPASVPEAPARKMQWVAARPGEAPDYSPEQGRALLHNLAGIGFHTITIRAPAEDAAARSHADWFKSIFQHAGWTVHGPEEIATAPLGTVELLLGVPELPVAKAAASTFLALKAAGFETLPVLDIVPAHEPDTGMVSLSLTVPATVPATEIRIEALAVEVALPDAPDDAPP